MYLFYFLLAALLFFGAQYMSDWNDSYTTRDQTIVLRGAMALGVALHHMAQKTCAPWHPYQYRVHGLDPFLHVGYLFSSVFLFCSGMGLYRSLRQKPDYLKGFPRKRILPIIIAFYLSEILYTAVRLAMGRRMDAITAIWYLSGLHMANPNAWFVVAIVFLYLIFWTAFRRCRREGIAILSVALFALAYAALGATVGHQDNWWMQGEWWYNSIMLFPLGLLFGKYENQITAFLKKGYLFWLILSFAATLLLFRQSEWINNNGWGYYGTGGISRSLMSAGLQWCVATAFTSCCFLLMMKIRFGNRALSWLGSESLGFYLMHGLFVEFFGYNFMDISKSVIYIRNLPVYIAVVLACSALATLLFGRVWRWITGFAQGIRRIPGKAVLFRFALVLLLLCLIPSLPGRNERVRIMNGMVFHLPEHYSRRYSDSRYAVWEYTGSDRKPGNLILDADIRDSRARNLSTVKEVLETCEWLMGAELYVNPNGIRMVRGYAEYSGNLERRYYIEGTGSVMLMCMIEDERFYNSEDCEFILEEVAESVNINSGHIGI